MLADKCGLNDSFREVISDFWEEEWKSQTCDLKIGSSMKTRLQVEAASQKVTIKVRYKMMAQTK